MKCRMESDGSPLTTRLWLLPESGEPFDLTSVGLSAVRMSMDAEDSKLRMTIETEYPEIEADAELDPPDWFLSMAKAFGYSKAKP